MSARHRLKGDLPRALGRHDGAQGRAYRRFYTALAQEHGPFPKDSLRAYQAAQVATLWLSFVAEEEARRPEGQIERHEREQQEKESAGVARLIAFVRTKAPTPAVARFEASIARMREERTPEDYIYRGA